MPISPFSGLDGDPFATMRRLQNELFRGAPGMARASSFPAVNVWQGPDSVALTAELPGVESSDIDITVKDDRIAISGSRKAPEDAEGAAWLRRERAYGDFSRVVQLPYRVDPDRVEARFQDGVLKVELQRPDTDKPRRIQIKAA